MDLVSISQAKSSCPFLIDVFSTFQKFTTILLPDDSVKIQNADNVTLGEDGGNKDQKSETIMMIEDSNKNGESSVSTR